jgi:hypothetical protein
MDWNMCKNKGFSLLMNQKKAWPLLGINILKDLSKWITLEIVK